MHDGACVTLGRRQTNMFAHSRVYHPLILPFRKKGSPFTYSSAASREVSTAIVPSASSLLSRNAPAIRMVPLSCSSQALYVGGNCLWCFGSRLLEGRILEDAEYNVVYGLALDLYDLSPFYILTHLFRLPTR